MSDQPTALIVGAGIGGLAAAIVLGRNGWQVRVFERTAEPRELGFALALAPNAVAALQELGVADPIVSRAHAVTGLEACRPDGHVLRRLNASAAGRLLVVLRPVIHGTLLESITDARLELSSKVMDVRDAGGHAELVLADGTEVRGDVVVGADGFGSTVRARLHPSERLSTARYCGLRGVAHGVVPRLDGLSGTAYLGDGLEAAAIQAGGDAVYWYMSLLASDVPAGARDPVEVRARFEVGFHDRFRSIVDATAAGDLRFDEFVEREPLTAWGSGRITLLGDAAHPMLPHTGQGAAQALEDAVALGLVLRPDADVPRSLRRYEQVRARRTRRLVRRGRMVARGTTTHNRFIHWLRSTAITMMPEAVLVWAGRLADRGDPHKELRTS